MPATIVVAGKLTAMFPESTWLIIKSALAAIAGIAGGFAASYGIALLTFYTGLAGLYTPLAIIFVAIALGAAFVVVKRSGFDDNRYAVVFLIASAVAILFFAFLPQIYLATA